MKKKKIYILAPNDRFNYGDFLFPYILTHYLNRDNVEFVYCSTTESDFSELGGIRTRSHQALYRLDETFDNYLIIAGGECLFAKWSIVSYIDPVINKLEKVLYKYKFLRVRDINNLLSMTVKLKYHVKTRYPFTIARRELPGFKAIMYNSVGGSYLKWSYRYLNQEDVKAINDCDYLSVRDEATYEGLSALGVKSQIVADSAILMSEVFSEAWLREKVHPSLLSKTDYIFFQINHSLWKKNKEAIINQLRDLHQNLGLRFILCPIGTALGHSDHLALSDLQQQLGEDISLFVPRPTIWDIMHLIKNSSLYIGSSLHGVITAMSFNRPFVTFGVEKVKAYIRYWVHDTHDDHIADIESIMIKSQKAINIKTPNIDQIRSITTSLNLIAAKINQ